LDICIDSQSSCTDTCSDSLDNDNDNCTDSIDSDCGGIETICDGQDDNCNGQIDEGVCENKTLLDIVNITELYENNTTRIFEFKIKNNEVSTLNNVSWSLDFGDGTTLNNQQNITLQSEEDAFVYIEYEYTTDGVYNLTIAVTDGNLTDSESMVVLIGNLLIANLSVLHSNNTERIFEFEILNNANSTIENISWSLDTDQTTINSTNNITLDPQESIFVYVDYDYTSYGDYVVTVTANRPNGTFSANMSITVKDIGVTNLTELYSNYTEKVFEFIIKSYIGDRNVSWSLDMNDSTTITSNDNITLAKNEEAFIYVDYNYSSTGNYTINATATTEGVANSMNLTVEVS